MAKANLDFEKALSYVGKDPQWVNKLLAGAGIMLAIFAIFFIPIVFLAFTGSALIFVIAFCLSFLCSFILSLGLAGYIAQTVNKKINYQNSLLPDWSEFGHFIVTGLKYFAGYFLYLLPLLILCGIFAFIVGLSLGYGCCHSGLYNAFAFLFLTFLGACALFLYLLIIIFCPLMMANFYKDLKILSFVDYKSAFEMLKGNVGNYFILILLFIALAILGQFICYVLFFTIIGVILIPVIYFYLYLVAADLIAQYVLISKEDE